MNKQVKPIVVKWPFFLADAILLAVAGWIYLHSKLPMGAAEMFLYVVAVGLAALMGVTPFLLEYWATVKLGEAAEFATAAAQLQNLDRVAGYIIGATAQWQQVQEESTKTVCAAKDIADRMTAEARAFTDFVQKANASEKATLRLEIEKLHRAENDWLQVVMRILDHVYALHQAALRSGQPGLIEQLDQFQNACHEACRRIGLIPFHALAGKPFDAKNHRLVDEQAKVPAAALVSETIATGYTYQGQLLRLALVSLQPTEEPASPVASPPSTLPTRKKTRDLQPIDDPSSPEAVAGAVLPAEQPPLI